MQQTLVCQDNEETMSNQLLSPWRVDVAFKLEGRRLSVVVGSLDVMSSNLCCQPAAPATSSLLPIHSVLLIVTRIPPTAAFMSV